jgi:hypothetical protein
MKAYPTFIKCLRFTCLLTVGLALQGGCVPVQDKNNRENQIKNASKTFVEAYMAKRILRHKEAVKDTYAHLYLLQDSIRKAMYDTRTVEDLRIASLQTEIQDLEGINNELAAYIDYKADDEYTFRFGELLLSENVPQSADKLYRMLNYMSNGMQLPTDYQGFRELGKSRNMLLFNLHEYLHKRSLAASQAYRNWAELYRQKGAELSQLVVQDKRFTMTDLERIEIARLADQYLALSLELTEKSDSLLAAVEETPNPQKTGAERKMNTYLRLQNLAQ